VSPTQVTLKASAGEAVKTEDTPRETSAGAHLGPEQEHEHGQASHSAQLHKQVQCSKRLTAKEQQHTRQKLGWEELFTAKLRSKVTPQHENIGWPQKIENAKGFVVTSQWQFSRLSSQRRAAVAATKPMMGQGRVYSARHWGTNT
jgi:hypothetical protein